jgi:cytochrome c oxidase cbb3-type subunit 4
MSFQEFFVFARSLWVVWLMLIFLGIVLWVMWPRNRKRFDDAAQIPFKDDKDRG